jgi:hypothetical protein
LNGAFNVLCKVERIISVLNFLLTEHFIQRRLDREFFVVLKHATDGSAKASPSSTESLRDALLRDTFSRAADNDPDTFQNVLDNLNTYVEVVHHKGYSTELMQSVFIYFVCPVL